MLCRAVESESIDAGRHLPLQHLLPAATGLRFAEPIQRYRRHCGLEAARHPPRPPRHTFLC